MPRPHGPGEFVFLKHPDAIELHVQSRHDLHAEESSRADLQFNPTVKIAIDDDLAGLTPRLQLYLAFAYPLAEAFA